MNKHKALLFKTITLEYDVKNKSKSETLLWVTEVVMITISFVENPLSNFMCIYCFLLFFVLRTAQFIGVFIGEPKSGSC